MHPTETEKAQLLPCPFCGGQPKLRYYYENYPPQMSTENQTIGFFTTRAHLRARLREEQQARQTAEQSNLALRKKCADLKAQLAAAQQSIEQLEAALRLRN